MVSIIIIIGTAGLRPYESELLIVLTPESLAYCVTTRCSSGRSGEGVCPTESKKAKQHKEKMPLASAATASGPTTGRCYVADGGDARWNGFRGRIRSFSFSFTQGARKQNSLSEGGRSVVVHTAQLVRG